MHESTPERVATITAVAADLIAGIQGAVAASAPFIAAAGAATAQLRSEAQLGNLFEDDPSLANQFAITLRTVAILERLANESAQANQRLITLSRQLDGDTLALGTLLTELEL